MIARATATGSQSCGARGGRKSKQKAEQHSQGENAAREQNPGTQRFRHNVVLPAVHSDSYNRYSENSNRESQQKILKRLMKGGQFGSDSAFLLVAPPVHSRYRQQKQNPHKGALRDSPISVHLRPHTFVGKRSRSGDQQPRLYPRKNLQGAITIVVSHAAPPIPAKSHPQTRWLMIASSTGVHRGRAVDFEFPPLVAGLSRHHH